MLPLLDVGFWKTTCICNKTFLWLLTASADLPQHSVLLHRQATTSSCQLFGRGSGAPHLVNASGLWCCWAAASNCCWEQLLC